MTWRPSASVLMGALVALPPLSATGAPKLTPSIWNCTVPVGVPAPGILPVTVAVKVTAWLLTDGSADELTAVVVAYRLTVWPPLSVPVLPRSLASPLYTAVMTWFPSASVLMGALVALPPLSATGAPKLTPAIWNCTVPVGLGAPGMLPVTVAVKVTDWPLTAGL